VPKKIAAKVPQSAGPAPAKGTSKPFLAPAPKAPLAGAGAGSGPSGTNIKVAPNPPPPPPAKPGHGDGSGPSGTNINVAPKPPPPPPAQPEHGDGSGPSGTNINKAPVAAPRSGGPSPEPWPMHRCQINPPDIDLNHEEIPMVYNCANDKNLPQIRGFTFGNCPQIRKDPQQARMATQYPERAKELERKLEAARQHEAERAQLSFKFACVFGAPAENQASPPVEKQALPPAGMPPPPPPPPPADAPVDARKDASKDARKDAEAGAPNVVSTDGPHGEPVYKNELQKAAEEREAQAKRVAENFAKMEREREEKLAELRKQQAKSSLQRRIEDKFGNANSRLRSGSQKSQEWSRTAIKQVNGNAGQVKV
jgi:hypothetical protein